MAGACGAVVTGYGGAAVACITHRLAPSGHVGSRRSDAAFAAEIGGVCAPLSMRRASCQLFRFRRLSTKKSSM